MRTKESQFTVESRGPVSALLLRPEGARLLYVLGHGAGAGMKHPFMERVATELAERRIATFRYQFPYMEAGRRSPDPPKVLEETVRAAIAAAHRAVPDLPLIAGGKSMGGRISSHVATENPPSELQGLVFLGYPLHAPKKPAARRATHLGQIDVPMLFLQGTRDDLADLALLAPIVQRLGSNATLHVVEGGDHSFKVLKRSGRTEDEVLAEIADAIDSWAERVA
ncbi:MAG: dienelactone hydrolase family protein [Gemmatimonadota bacterium]|nr:MAG: dienelactone hydrolase family protein [Gemmatimonadota bacterium]